MASIKRYNLSGTGIATSVSIIALQDEKPVVSVSELGDTVYATLAIVDGVIYLRTHNKPFAFQDKARK